MELPGFIIHIIHGNLILERIKYCFDADDIKKFVTGILIPDSCRGEKKEISHFIAPYSRDRILQIPDVDAFADKYREHLSEPFVMGYLAHLWLDKTFFEDFFLRNIQFQDENGKPTLYPDNIRKVYLSRLNKYISVNELFSEDYLYGYYTALNKSLIEKYNLAIPEKTVFLVPVDEVQLDDFDGILSDLEHYFSVCCTVPPVPVFDQNELEEFLSSEADNFLKYLT